MCYFRPGYNSSVIDPPPRQVRPDCSHATCAKAQHAWIGGTSRQQTVPQQLHHSHTRVPTPRVFSPSLLSLNHHIARCSSQKHQDGRAEAGQDSYISISISNQQQPAGERSFSVGGPLQFAKDTTTVIIKKPRTPKSLA